MIFNKTERIDKYIKILVLIFLFFTPLHYLLFNILLSSFSFLKIWKEVIIIVLILLYFFKKITEKSINTKYKFSNIISFSCGLFFIVSLIYLLITPYKVPAISILRNYLIPIILYYIIKDVRFKSNELKIGFNILASEVSLISLYAISQSLFLGPQFLINLGYPIRENGRLSTSFYLSGFGDFQRAVGSFVSSNTFAFFLSLFFIICLYLICNKKLTDKVTKIITYITILTSFIGLFLTFSRSSWIATAFTSLLILIDSTKKNKINLIRIKKISLIIIFTTVIGILLLSLLSEYNFFSLIYKYALNTISFKDTSTLSHLSSFSESFDVFSKNIFGTSLGLNGPKAANYFSTFYHTESSYFLILFEFGIIGFLIYFFIYFTVPYKFYVKKWDIGISAYLFIFSMIAYIFLPYVQDLEIISYLFISLGLSISHLRYIDNPKYNLLFLHSSSEFYGSDKSLYNLVTKLYKEENSIDKIHVILPENGILKTKIEMSTSNSAVVKCHNIGVLRRKNFNFIGIIKYFIEYFCSLIYLFFYINKNQINVVYTNTSVVMPGGLAAKLLSVKNIWHIRETIDKNSVVNKLIIRYITILSDVIIANSNSTMQSFLINPFQNNYVVYNAVEPIEKVKSKYTFKDTDFVIGMAGRINKWKGQEIFIDAAYKIKEMTKSKCNICFLIAGDAYPGDEYLIDKLNIQIEALYMKEDILMLGQLNDMKEFYNCLDLFILPSTKPEPFGLVIIEAMSLGIPVIASNEGGPLEIIEDGVDGILFESKSSEELAKQVVKLISDKSLYKSISKNAIEKQQKKFSINNYYQSIYQIIIGG